MAVPWSVVSGYCIVDPNPRDRVRVAFGHEGKSRPGRRQETTLAPCGIENKTKTDVFVPSFEQPYLSPTPFFPFAKKDETAYTTHPPALTPAFCAHLSHATVQEKHGTSADLWCVPVTERVTLRPKKERRGRPVT